MPETSLSYPRGQGGRKVIFAVVPRLWIVWAYICQWFHETFTLRYGANVHTFASKSTDPSFLSTLHSWSSTLMLRLEGHHWRGVSGVNTQAPIWTKHRLCHRPFHDSNQYVSLFLLFERFNMTDEAWGSTPKVAPYLWHRVSSNL